MQELLFTHTSSSDENSILEKKINIAMSAVVLKLGDLLSYKF